MDDRLQRHGFEESEYERPNRWWKCGHADEGRPCHVGPDALGRCRATHECSPARRGDRWECTRPPRRGGACEHGPRPDGTCSCPIETCQPELTVRAKRGLTTLGAAAVTLGAVLALLAGPWFEETRRSVLLPGDLTRGHAAIDECAACHVEGTAGEGEMAAAGAGAAAGPDTASGEEGDGAAADGTGAGDADGAEAAAGGAAGDPHAGLDPSARCMTCHVPGGERPLSPHGLSRDTLDAIARGMEERGVDDAAPLALRLAALGPEPPGGPGEGLACATCHREHRGRDARLTEMGNLRCQSCHSVRFAGFDRGHPELDLPGPREELPYRFDHAAHEAEHFPDEDAEFTCAGCHGGAPEAGPAAGSMGEKSFETMCGDCHTGEIREGALTLVQIPGIDYRILSENGVSVGAWPVDAGIDVVTPISPVTRALLAADSTAAEDLRTLQGVDLTFVEGLGSDILRAAGDLAWQVKELFRDLSDGGRDALVDRLERGLGVELTGREAVALADQRSADEPRPRQPAWLTAVRSARAAWLPGLEGELSRREAGATPPLDVLEDYGPVDPAPEGWMIDSFDFTVRYLPRGHADPFLRTLTEVSARAAPADSQAARLFDLLTSEDGPVSCGKCHTPAADRSPGGASEPAAEGRAAGAGPGGAAGRDVGAEGRRASLWTEGTVGLDLGPLTRFDHGPHRVVACRDCHTVEPEGGIRPAGRKTCASCHGSDRASASCLNCHAYHADAFALNVERAMHPPAAEEAGGADGGDADDGGDDGGAGDDAGDDSADEPEGGAE